jgi:hypothetical protein
MIEQLSNWDGKSDIILIADSENGISIKVLPAETMRRILRRYAEFIETHELVFDTETTEQQFLVSAHWEKKS